MNPGIILILSVFCLSVQILFAQQQDAVIQNANTPVKVIQTTKPHYLSLSFDFTGGMSSGSGWKNPKGISFSYVLSTAKRYSPAQYYLGVLFSIAGKGMDTPYNAAGVMNGKINWSYSTLLLGITQRYFFKSTSNSIPFVDLDLGWRSSYNQVSSEFDMYSRFIGYYHSGEDIYENQDSGFSAGLGIGLYFQILGLSGPFTKLGLATGNKSLVMMPDYRVTKYTNQAFFTLSFGIML